MEALSEPPRGPDHRYKEDVRLIRALADEIRLQMHLAGMEFRSHWAEMEPALKRVQQRAEDASEASQKTVEEMVKALEEFRGRLGRERRSARAPR